jgi:hypothetical protein
MQSANGHYAFDRQYVEVIPYSQYHCHYQEQAPTNEYNIFFSIPTVM